MMIKPISLRAAVKSVGTKEAPKKKKTSQKDDSPSERAGPLESAAVIVGLVAIFLGLWYCAALMVFGNRYGIENATKKITCETCSQCPVHPYDKRGEIKTRKYWNKNRVTPREFYARLPGTMLFQKFPELKKQAEPVWTLDKGEVNEPYYKWFAIWQKNLWGPWPADHPPHMLWRSSNGKYTWDSDGKIIWND